MEVGVCCPLSFDKTILTVFDLMSMVENTDSFLFLQNLLCLADKSLQLE